MRRLLTAARRLAICGLAGAAVWAAPASAQDAAALGTRQEALRQALADSVFGRPVVLQSSDSTSQPHGDVYAIVKQPFATVSASLRRGATWCDVMLLQTNVRKCTAGGEAASPSLNVGFVRKSTLPAEDAQFIAFSYAVQTASDHYLAVQMSAPSGPLGTSDYKLTLEAIPVGDGRSFVHMSYSYTNGVAARIATNAYLATVGRNKVGFSVIGKDAQGEPIYVDGTRGMAERATMRYYLAIETVLAMDSGAAEQLAETRLNHWYAAIEQYPRQLKDMERADYLAIKRRDLQISAPG